MRRQQENRRGVLLIDKPAGISSAEVLRKLKHKFKIKKLGHAGTLDPLAEGVLIVLVGEYTKLAQMFLGSDKTYRAEAILGAVSNTQDSEGEITATNIKNNIDEATLTAAMQSFVGEYEQMPPAFSAKKVNGQTAYTLARKGLDVSLNRKLVKIHYIKSIVFNPPKFSFEVKCSSGTYIRTLCHDIGDKLGVGAYMSALRRVASGNIDESMCKPLDEILQAEQIDQVLQTITPNMLLASHLVVSESDYKKMLNGMPIPIDTELASQGMALAVFENGEIAGMIEITNNDNQTIAAPRRMLHIY